MVFRVLRHFLGRLDFRDADYIDCNADPDPTPRKTGSGSDLSKYPDQDSTSKKSGSDLREQSGSEANIQEKPNPDPI